MKRVLLFVLASFIIGLALSQDVAPVRAQTYTGCENAPSINLTTGHFGRVTDEDTRSNRVREHADHESSIVTMIPSGDTFFIVAGPRCADGWRWWQVTYKGLSGWTSDGEGSVHYLEMANPAYAPTAVPAVTVTPTIVLPIAVTATPRVTPTPLPTVEGTSCALAPSLSRLTVGQNARVTDVDGRPNNLRLIPSVNAKVIVTVAVGRTVHVLRGPRCYAGYRWWKVQYGDFIGWMGDGIRENGHDVYYLEPANG